MLSNLLWSIVGGFIGACIAILFQKYQEPKLDIIATERANTDHVYPHGRWKFFRVFVVNKPVNKYLSRLVSRSSALQASATIEIKELNQTMKGRWAGTLELVDANPADYIRIINFPDPKNLIAGGIKEELDVFTKSADDEEAYGWNNEAYIHNWRTPRLKMIPGIYTIEVTVTAIDGSQVKKMFKAYIKKSIEETRLVKSKEKKNIELKILHSTMKILKSSYRRLLTKLFNVKFK